MGSGKLRTPLVAVLFTCWLLAGCIWPGEADLSWLLLEHCSYIVCIATYIQHMCLVQEIKPHVQSMGRGFVL
jgi:hypothetical protein